MKTFRYSAVDAQGRAVSGSLDAGDWTAARLQLIAQGLRDPVESPAESADGTSTSLPVADAVELASYVSELVSAGLPLPAGLRAVAADLPAGRFPKALDALSARLQAGHSLESALAATGTRLPARLRDLMVASARSGRMAATLDKVLAHERSMEEIGSRFWQAIGYPAVLVVLLIGWLLLVTLWLVPEMQLEEIFSDYGKDANSAPVAFRLLEFSRILPPFVLGVFCVTVVTVGVAWVVGGMGLLSRLFAQVPLIGPAWWYRGLIDFSELLAMFLDLQLPLPEALRLVGVSSRDAAVRVAAGRLADQIATGQPLARSLGGHSLFPATLVNLADWGQQQSALAESLHGARQMFVDRFELQIQLMRLVVPPVVFLLVASSAVFVAVGVVGGVPKIMMDLM